MPSPFPGMDPYIERPEIWPDFHNHLVTAIKAALQPSLRPRYAALLRHRLFTVESEGSMDPVYVVQPGGADIPAIFEFRREEIRQPLIQIIEPAAGNRVITAIEVLSPDNKAAGEGRDSYLQKREEYWASGTNLVEIDLLRVGQPTVRVSAEHMATLSPWHYLVAVMRRWPSRQEVYAVPLSRRLPRIAVPLAVDDRDVPLDLQAAFTRCWDEGPYPELLRYEGPPPGTLTPDEMRWCEDMLRQAGLRPPAQGQPS